MKKKLIMVMGVQRSGTTALFKSLARDSALTSFDERVDDSIYYLYRLRPLREIAPHLDAASGPVLLKPITETVHRSFEDLRDEYSAYALQFIWIYRDPINVLRSMSRKGWFPFGSEGKNGPEKWVARNLLALRYQKKCPAEILIVRYEDLICDPRVFRSLCESLGVNGVPTFRGDQGSGWRDVPAAVQGAIRDITSPTLRALDSARTFRARPLRKLRAFASTKLAGLAKGPAPINSGDALDEWKQGVVTAAPKPASDFAGLFFWLDAGQLSAPNSRIREVQERGPLCLRAVADGQPPFWLPFLNRQPALFFPTSKAPERLRGDRGLLRFRVPGTEAFPLFRNSFSVVALVKPHVPMKPHGNQNRVIALRVRSEDENAEFTLEWDRDLQASRGIVKLGEHCSSVVTERASHPPQEWRIINFHLQRGPDSQLLISADGIESIAPMAAPDAPLPSSPDPDWTIELGGSEADPDALFYGAIAEVILFSRHLIRTEQFAIASYLKQKYQL